MLSIFAKSTSSSAPRFRIQAPPGMHSFRVRFGRLGFVLLLVVLPLFVLRACVVTYVPPDEIGMRQVSFGPGKGLQKQLVEPGYRRAVSGYERVSTFPRDIQVVEFTNNSAESSEGHRQVAAVRVPTVDGYPVDVDQIGRASC